MLSSIAEFIPPSGLQTAPDGITAGPGGNVWFTEENANQIGVINSATQRMSEFAVPTSGAQPFRITPGPDGNLWFTEVGADKIGMINPTTGKIEEFAVPTPSAQPFEITAGPDGTIWFTEWGANQIGMLTIATGKISEFPIPTGDAVAEGITLGPDGNIYFTESVAGKLGMINPTSHSITEPVTLAGGSSPEGITSGPGGALWFTEPGTNQIGTYYPATGSLKQVAIPTAGSKPVDVVAGLAGNVWFTQGGTNQIGMLNPATESIVELTPATAGSGPRGIASAPDGNIWFAELGSGKVGVVANTHVVVMSSVPSDLATGTAFGLTVKVELDNGAVDTGYMGDVTISALDGYSCGALAGTTTMTCTNGVATFTGLSMNIAGSYTLEVTGGLAAAALVGPLVVSSPGSPGPDQPPSTKPSSSTPLVAPTIIGEQVLTAGKGKHKHIIGFKLVFSELMNPASAADAANYSIIETAKHSRAKIAQPLRFKATYNALADSVSLMVAGKPRFASGGRLLVKATPTSGISSAAGAYLDGNNAGTAGDDGVFDILPGGSGIRR
jgi:virginiamycin B lyase